MHRQRGNSTRFFRQTENWHHGASKKYLLCVQNSNLLRKRQRVSPTLIQKQRTCTTRPPGARAQHCTSWPAACSNVEATMMALQGTLVALPGTQNRVSRKSRAHYGLLSQTVAARRAHNSRTAAAISVGRTRLTKHIAHARKSVPQGFRCHRCYQTKTSMRAVRWCAPR